MMTTFDPSIAENYSRVFAQTSQHHVKQDKLRFSEPVHYTSEMVVIKEIEEPAQRTSVPQKQLQFSEPLHY